MTHRPPPLLSVPVFPEVLRFSVWRRLDGATHDPRSSYAEHFWLPTIGPTGLWLLRRVAEGFDFFPEGFEADLRELAVALGVPGGQGANSPLRKTLGRLIQFDLARLRDPSVLVVRRLLPSLPPSHLPPSLRALYADNEQAAQPSGRQP